MGALYLGTIVAGLFAELGSRGSLIVGSDAAATATAILAHRALFRAGLIGIAVLAVDSCFLLSALRLLNAPSYLMAGMATPQREAMALLSLKLHGDGYDLSLVFFGVYA